MPHSPADRTRLVVVLFDRGRLGSCRSRSGVFDLAVHDGAMPEPDAVIGGGRLATPRPYDLAGLCDGAFVLAEAGLLDEAPDTVVDALTALIG